MFTCVRNQGIPKQKPNSREETQFSSPPLYIDVCILYTCKEYPTSLPSLLYSLTFPTPESVFVTESSGTQASSTTVVAQNRALAHFPLVSDGVMDDLPQKDVFFRTLPEKGGGKA